MSKEFLFYKIGNLYLCQYSPNDDWNKTYKINGKIYGEAFYMVKDMVYHWQGMEGLPPHITSFRYIPRSEFTTVLDKYFRLSLITEKNSDLYICVRKE